MKDSKVLFKIKSLEKLIVRYLFNDCDISNSSKLPTPTQMQIIEYILEHDNEAVYQKDLEEVLNLRRATVSGVLQTMEKNGLLKRSTHDTDLRAKKIKLDDKAKDIFNFTQKKLKEIDNIIIKNITSKDLEIFSKVIDIMSDNLKKEEGK